MVLVQNLNDLTYRKDLSSARKDKNQNNSGVTNNISNNYQGTSSGSYIKNIEYDQVKEERKVNDYQEIESLKYSKNSVNSLNAKNNDKDAFETNLSSLPSIEKVNFNDKRANLKSAVVRRPIKCNKNNK